MANKPRQFFMILTQTLILIGCGRAATNLGTPPSGSELATVNVALPDRSKVENGDKMDGFSLKISPVDSTCSGTKFETAKKWATTKIDTKVKKACAHKIVVELGVMEGTALKDVYFTNKDDAANTISKDELAKTDPKFTVNLKITKAGVDAGLGDLPEDDQANVAITINLPQTQQQQTPSTKLWPTFTDVDVETVDECEEDLMAAGFILGIAEFKSQLVRKVKEDKIDCSTQPETVMQAATIPDGTEQYDRCSLLGANAFITVYTAKVNDACK